MFFLRFLCYFGVNIISCGALNIPGFWIIVIVGILCCMTKI